MRIGIVGAGFMGGIHARSWANTPATLAGVVSANNASRLADQYNITAYNSLDELIADVDVVDICTPTHLHHEQVLKVARAGKHIVCEKPLARTLTEAQAMISACEEAGVQLLVAHVVRFFPQYALAKATVESGELGDVGVTRLKRTGFQPAWGKDSWFHDIAKSGGMMLDLMIHDYDYARWVAGDVESVFAKNVRSHDPQAKGDYGLAILRHTNGALSHIEGAWANPPPLFRTGFEIAGSQGLIEHGAEKSKPLSVHLHASDAGEQPEITVPKSPLNQDPYTTQAQHFYDLLMGTDVQPVVTAEDGMKALQIALTAIKSAQTGKRVYIQEVQA